MSTKVQSFGKYEGLGAYHWRSVVDRGKLRACALLNSRYDIPLRLLNDRLNIESAYGLDLGCGDGVMVYKVSTAGGTICGLDASEQGLGLAKAKLEEYRVATRNLVGGSCYDIPFKDRAFDYVVAIEVVEHLHDVDSALRNVSSVLRPGGYFVCTTPNASRDAPQELDPFHFREYSAEDLRRILNGHFEDVSVVGCHDATLQRLYANRAISRIVKLLAYCGLNLFCFTSRRASENRWNTLVGIGRKRTD